MVWSICPISRRFLVPHAWHGQPPPPPPPPNFSKLVSAMAGVLVECCVPYTIVRFNYSIVELNQLWSALVPVFSFPGDEFGSCSKRINFNFRSLLSYKKSKLWIQKMITAIFGGLVFKKCRSRSRTKNSPKNQKPVPTPQTYRYLLVSYY